MQPLWKTVWRFCKKLKRELPYDLAILLLGKYQKKKNKPQEHSFEKIRAPQCSRVHYLQLPRYGSDLSVHQQMNGWRCAVCEYISIYLYVYTHTHNGIYSVIKKNENFPSAAKWIDLKGIMLSKVSQRKINFVWYHLYVESKTYNELVNKTKSNRLTDLENKLVVIRGERERGKGREKKVII